MDWFFTLVERSTILNFKQCLPNLDSNFSKSNEVFLLNYEFLLTIRVDIEKYFHITSNLKRLIHELYNFYTPVIYDLYKLFQIYHCLQNVYFIS